MKKFKRKFYEKQEKKLRKIIAVLLALIVTIAGTFSVQGAGTAPKRSNRVVRVGCIGYDGFIKADKNGVFRGYGVEFLDKVSLYTGWTFEFVEGVWDELLVDLKNGKIDLLCSAQKTPDREKIYLFSDRSVGTEETVIYARSDDEDIYYQDYEALNGKTVGMVQGTVQIPLFKTYAREHGIEYTARFYAYDAETAEALYRREIEAAVLGRISNHENLKVVDRFGERAFYCITNRNNTSFMAELNDALDCVYADFPDIQRSLMNEYFEHYRYSESPLLSRKEAEYIANMEKTVRIGCITGLYPVGYLNSETGEPDGICVAILKKIEEISGIDFEIEALPIDCNPEELIRNKEYDLVAGVLYNRDVISDPEFYLTDWFFSQPYAVVALKGNDIYRKKEPVISLSISFERYPSLLGELPFTENFIYCRDPEKCLEELRVGNADLAIISTYVLNPFLHLDKYKNLVITTLPGLEVKNTMLTSSEIDYELYSAINKSIACISDETIREIVGHYTTGTVYKFTIKEVMAKYHDQILLAMILVMSLFVYLFSKRKHLEKIQLERIEKEIYKQRAETDRLTGLYNQEKFSEECIKYMEENQDKECRLVFLNVENFKLINELFGIEEGDKFLQFLADIIRGWCVENNSLCTRHEADKFVIMTNKGWDEIEAAAELMRAEIKKYPLAISVDVCAGAYIVDDRNCDIKILCGRARMAADSVKGSHMSRLAVYDDSNRLKMIRERMIVGEMDDALQTGQFCVYFQPKYNIKTGEVIGSEALVRWQHPTDGLRSPAMFIPVFEKNGFISKLDFYVYEEVCKYLRQWLDNGKRVVPVSVNLSRVGFHNPELCENLCRIADNYRIPHRLLELEVTETAYARDSELMCKCLQQLRKEGFRILMDDFGSGYSSLNMLKEAPIDEIKLDMRFLSASDPYGRAEKIIGMVIGMGKEMSLQVLAEGVETENQKKMLESFQCYMAQGYYYSRPVPVEEYEQLL